MKERTEYVDEDLIDVANGIKTVQEICDKYHVRKICVYNAMSRRGLLKTKTPILVTQGNRKVIYNSINECAKHIGISAPTLYKALKKEKTILEVKGIKVEVYHGGKK